jgi:hypothetical protein
MAAGQLAGLLILAPAGASKGHLDGTLLDAARLTYKETRERVLNLAVEDSILHVGHHLRQAAGGIEATFANVDARVEWAHLSTGRRRSRSLRRRIDIWKVFQSRRRDSGCRHEQLVLRIRRLTE